MTDKTLKDKTIDIKGKKYAMVKDRVQWLSDNKEGKYSINTDYKYFESQRLWVVRAVLTVDNQMYTGLAQEVESDDHSKVNNSSALENCETSAIGRACAAYGLGIQESYASANEMNKAPRTTKYATEKQIKWIRDTAMKVNDQLDIENVDEFVKEILTITPAQVPIYKVKDAVDKLEEWDSKQTDELIAKNIDTVHPVDPDKPINLDELPY